MIEKCTKAKERDSREKTWKMNKILHSIFNNVFAYRVFKPKKGRSSLKTEAVAIADAIASESFPKKWREKCVTRQRIFEL